MSTCGPTDTPDDIDIDALREKYAARAGEATAARKAPTQYLELEGRFRGVLRGRSLHAGDGARPDRRRRRGRHPRRWLRRTAGRRVSEEGRRRGRPGHRDGRRLRRRLVLEPIPRNPVRQRRVLLHPAARRARFHAVEEVRRRRRDLPALPQHRQAFRPVRRRAVLHPGARTALGRRRLERWRISTDRGDDIRARFVVMAQGSYNRPKLPGIPGIKDFDGPRLPLRALGLRLHRRRRRAAAWTSWRTSASRSSAPARPVSSWFRTWAEMPSSSIVFQRTPSSVDERANTPTDPEWAASLQPGWQEERKRNFHNWSPFVGVVFGEPDLVCDFWTELGRNMTARIAASEDPAVAGHRADHGDPGRGRLQDHGAAAPPHRRHRRRSRHRRGAQAVLPVHVQAAVFERGVPGRPSTAPTSRSSTCPNPRVWNG